MLSESTVATPRKVEIQDMAVTGLSECCSNFRQVLVVTSQTLTVHPAALRAMGKARSTRVTGPEWPVKVHTGVEGEPETKHQTYIMIYYDGDLLLACFLALILLLRYVSTYPFRCSTV